jgi:hypothetical protein
VIMSPKMRIKLHSFNVFSTSDYTIISDSEFIIIEINFEFNFLIDCSRPCFIVL